MTTEESKKTCFVIAPIGEHDSDTRRWSDQVLRYIIRPAVEPCGYKAVRADDIDEPGIITSQVIQRVVEEPLVIADLTERNPNVFYELAIRHAVRKPFIQIINERENIPFDVAATRTILIDIHDLDKVESAKKQISEHIKSLEADPSDLETPISVSLDLQRLRQSENPEQRSFAEMVSVLSDIRGSMSILENRLTETILMSHAQTRTSMIQLQELMSHVRSNLESTHNERSLSGSLRYRREPSGPPSRILPTSPTRRNVKEPVDDPLEEPPW